ncbi:MAG: TPM domain-containing protein [Gloeobacteraceae cyanobacterium ES-bin-316]|nr:TPM domain-containing protein [Ferruginibacter sp.]
MAIFPFFKKKQLFTEDENRRIVSAIRTCEERTSGEIRVYIEAKNPYVSTMERAIEVFANLKMEQTEHRNGVILYIAHKHHEVALFGDAGIYEKTGAAFWDTEVKKMIANFKENHLPEGIIQCVLDVGEALHAAFPYMGTKDKNELPDDIVFGKL